MTAISAPFYLDDLYRSVVQAFIALANSDGRDVSRFYNKNSDFDCYGLNAPQIHAIIKSFRKRFRQLSVPERISLA